MRQQVGVSLRRWRVEVQGIVQGVGFRPFVHNLAVSMGLSGFVGNDAHGVFIEIEGQQASLTRFVQELREHPPPLAVIEQVVVGEVPVRGEHGFRIVASVEGTQRTVLISPDVATCDDCLRELWDPADRRYRYPFINCTNCGPRYTIIVDVPYDRARTTMATFQMCADCAREYHDPYDRRFHAQPVCCPACGPRLRLLDADGSPLRSDDPIRTTAELLAEGRIVAIKGLGGYHLAVDASDPHATAELRARKHREDKPFAIMVPDLDTARELCEISPEEERLLRSPRRPIVLLRRKPAARVAEAVAPGNRDLGLMLPYTPLHHLLCAEFGRPFVLTSGNVSDEPIAYEDDDALTRLGGIADAFLTHDRPIHIRTDDSVVRVVDGAEYPIRRARGYVPHPVSLHRDVPAPILGVGAELKNTVCLARGRYAFLSHHIGDLENYETYRSFTEAIAHLGRLFDISPTVIAHDLHPEYLSTKWALDQDAELVGVQHHHAHVAACLADNRTDGPVVGLAMDGVGYGTDGTIWGGEVLLVDLEQAERVGHLRPVPMPGGAAAIHEPWRMAVSYLEQLPGGPPAELPLVERHGDQVEVIRSLLRSGVNCPWTSSAGRLFDAVAALAGVRDRINYEGQAAIELEQRVDPREPGAYVLRLERADGRLVLDGVDMVAQVVEDVLGGAPVGVIAARFHRGLADGLTTAVEHVAERSGIRRVALSGGVFQNQFLLVLLTRLLRDRGFEVLLHRRVPCNDGGISLGQVAVAAAQLRRF